MDHKHRAVLRTSRIAALCVAVAGCGSSATVSQDRSPCSPSDTCIVSEGEGSVLETESDVAVDGDGMAIAAWMSLEAPTGHRIIGYALMDTLATASVSRSAIVQSDTGTTDEMADPVVAMDASGHAFIAFVTFREASLQQQNALFIARMSTATRGPDEAPARVPGSEGADKPWMLTGPDDAVYITWSKPDAQMLSISRDHGVHFSHQVVTSTTNVGHGRICLSGDGRSLVVTYLTESGDDAGGLVRVMARHLDVPTGTWDPERVVDDARELVAVDDAPCAASNRELWIAYGVTPDAPVAGDLNASDALLLAHSSDWAETIDSTKELRRATTASERFLHPSLALTSGGALWFAHYRGPEVNGDGATFETERLAATGDDVPVSIPVPNLAIVGDGSRWLGDYAGLAAHGESIWTTFTVNEGSAAHIRFARGGLSFAR